MTYKALQTGLLSAGYNPGPIDGVWGKSTLAALMALGAQKPISPVIRDAAAALIGAMVGKDITTPLRIVHFLAQMSHESGGWHYLTELGSNIYFQMYEPGTNKGRRLGNTQPGDGPRYKGRGFTMLTGRANYEDYGKKLGIDLIGHPEQAALPDVAARIAVQFWADRNLNALADRDDVEAVTLRINGGANGLADRALILTRLKRVWGI
ncbi:MAG TPA: glycoside hydrolase family 19 protein [Asticcacaulis sp.]|nr:glycoside hydrolase family 19 protein [Asticcacaulis sp.]